MDHTRTRTSVRTYNPNVRVANWNEELCMEEDMLKDFLGKQENGTLLIQRTQALNQVLLAKTNLSTGKEVNFNDTVMIVNPGREGLKPDGDKQMENLPRKLLEGRQCSSISLNVDTWPEGGFDTLVKSVINLTGSCNTESSCNRNTFQIVKINNQSGNDDPDAEPQPLCYGDQFAFRSSLDKNLYIFSDRIRLGGMSQSKSGNSSVELVPLSENSNGNIPYGAQWTIESFDPNLRMEHEGLPINRNEPIIIKHCATGQCLAAIEKGTVRTPFGRENELGVRTYYNSHKAEMDNNYWFLK